jgi:membrane protein DedA with SNARE-associated domain/rhodanese-related sulfurtransferase
VNYYLLHITYFILFLSVFGRQLCLPIPALLFLLSAGAMAGAGKLNFFGILAVAVLGCLLADLAWYEAGRRRGQRVLRMLCALAPDPSQAIRNSKSTFAARGRLALLIAKFVPGMDAIAPPLAGMAGTSRLSFLLFDGGGSALWAGVYIGAGFIFAKELDRVVRYTSMFADTLLLVLGVPLLLFFVWKLMRLWHMIRQLEPLYITAERLKERVDLGETIGILDLLRFEDDPEGLGGIPGAVRVDPGKMRRGRLVRMPDELDLVLYCGSKNSFVSARVAATMPKRGARRIRVLEGGLDAWKALDYPLSQELADPTTELARLGIVVAQP